METVQMILQSKAKPKEKSSIWRRISGRTRERSLNKKIIPIQQRIRKRAHVFPHGGPDAISMDDFDVFRQIFGSDGFLVFEPNFRGSIGYGLEHYRANRGRFGDIDYKDIMLGVDYLIKKGIADAQRLVIGGWSYGGTMTYWAVGHTNRFKAAVAVAGVSNLISRYGQSDINYGDIARWELLDVPIKNPGNFLKASPLQFLGNCKTPILIMHGENDDRVPVMQAWEAYRALKDIGTDVEMVLYPKATHGINSPKQFADVLQRWISWYKDKIEKK